MPISFRNHRSRERASLRRRVDACRCIKMNGEQTHKLATAYHEAGHALGALKVGRYVTRVVVSTASPGTGFVQFRKGARNPFYLCAGPGSARAAWDHTYNSIVNEIFVLLAGPLAEAKATATPLRQMGNTSDLNQCMRLVTKLRMLADFVSDFAEIPDFNEEVLLEEYRKRVRRWVGRPANWLSITAIAECLMRAGQVDGEQLSNIVGQSRGQNLGSSLVPTGSGDSALLNPNSRKRLLTRKDPSLVATPASNTRERHSARAILTQRADNLAQSYTAWI